VKWAGRAHVHNEWVRESILLGVARRKLLNFKKRNSDAPCDFSGGAARGLGRGKEAAARCVPPGSLIWP
jgi:hypothetical protein